jgi:hypothetical protein
MTASGAPPPAPQASPPTAPAGDGPSGIGGWLLLPLLGLVLTPVLGGIQVREVLKLMEPAPWKALTDPSSQAYHPFYAWMLPGELIANSVMAVLALVLLVLVYMRSPRVPMLMCVFYVLAAVVVIIDTGLASQIPGFTWDRGTIRDVARSVMGVVVWVPYFLVLKRVRNTFRAGAGR